MRCKLKDFCTVINGRAYSQKELLDKGKYRVLRVGNFFSSDRWYFSDLELPAEKYCNKGDLLFAWACSFGPRIWDGEDRTIFHYHIWKLDIDSAVVDKKYLYYLLKISVESMTAGTHGSVMMHITKSDMENFEFDIPTLEVQKKIAAILSALDEKIAINRAINENLERQVSEIYKSWYQDYSCAKGIPLVETEYGRIPKGWHYSILGELCKSVSVTHKFDVEKLVFLNTGDVEDGRFLHSNYMAVSDMPGQAKKTIAPDDILYSEIRPINKHYAYVTFPSEDYVVSTKLMVIRASGIDSRRLYHYLTTEDVITKLQMEAESRSGTFPQIRFDNIRKIPILIADDVTEADFTTLLRTVYNQIGQNNSENEKLASLRDSLFPRLMSGEIDVSDIRF